MIMLETKKAPNFDINDSLDSLISYRNCQDTVQKNLMLRLDEYSLKMILIKKSVGSFLVGKNQ